MSDSKDLVGQIALEWKFITAEQLNEALSEQSAAHGRGESAPLGQILMRRRLITAQKLAQLLQEQRWRTEGVPVFSRYEILDRLGEGGAAVVYRARDRKIGRVVALKVLRRAFALKRNSRRRFEREAQAAGGISHANVATLYDAGEEDERLYLAMELVEGRPMSELFAGRKMEPRGLVAVLEKAARGVAAAHAKGVVHRDLKPANILVTEDGEPKVVDFGLAHFVDSASALTKTGSTLGTPMYMAPEQVRGESKSITPRTDVYALGAILYQILAGRPPHAGVNALDVCAKVLEEEPPRPPGDPLLVAACLRAISKDAAKRHAGAKEFADDLRRALA